MIQDVLLPLALLGVLAWGVPWALQRLFPRSLPGLVLNGAVSATLLFGMGMALFAWLYGPAAGRVWAEAPAYFAVLSARSALLWAPVLVLALSAMPRRWPAGTWAVAGAADRRLPGVDEGGPGAGGGR